MIQGTEPSYKPLFSSPEDKSDEMEEGQLAEWTVGKK